MTKRTRKSFEELLTELNMIPDLEKSKQEAQSRANAKAREFIDEEKYKELEDIEKRFGIRQSIKLSETSFPSKLLFNGVYSTEERNYNQIKNLFAKEENIFINVDKKTVLKGIANGTFVSKIRLDKKTVELSGRHPDSFFRGLGYTPSYTKKDIANVYQELFTQFDKASEPYTLEKIIGLTLHLKSSFGHDQLQKRKENIYSRLLERPFIDYFASAYAMKFKLGIKPDENSLQKYYSNLTKKIDDDETKGEEWRIRWSARDLIRYSDLFEKPISVDEEHLRKIQIGILKWGLAREQDVQKKVREDWRGYREIYTTGSILWGRGYNEEDILHGINELERGTFGSVNLTNDDVQEIYKTHLKNISKNIFEDWTLIQIENVRKLTNMNPVFEKKYVLQIYSAMENKYLEEERKIREDEKTMSEYEAKRHKERTEKDIQNLQEKTKNSLMNVYDLTGIIPHNSFIKTVCMKES